MEEAETGHPEKKEEEKEGASPLCSSPLLSFARLEWEKKVPW